MLNEQDPFNLLREIMGGDETNLIETIKGISELLRANNLHSSECKISLARKERLGVVKWPTCNCWISNPEFLPTNEIVVSKEED